jgi:DNA invertase Pin-like site-specific DNA recombinase
VPSVFSLTSPVTNIPGQVNASRRKFDPLLFWSLDRLSRKGVLETLPPLNRLPSYGNGHRSFTEHYFESSRVLKDAVISILDTVAKQERVCLNLRRPDLRWRGPKGVYLAGQD